MLIVERIESSFRLRFAFFFLLHFVTPQKTPVFFYLGLLFVFIFVNLCLLLLLLPPFFCFFFAYLHFSVVYLSFNFSTLCLEFMSAQRSPLPPKFESCKQMFKNEFFNSHLMWQQHEQ